MEEFTRDGVPMFDKESVEEIQNDFGCSYQEAVRIAAATMDGANETPGGHIQATQTMCDVLHFDESVPGGTDVEGGGKEDPLPLSRFQIF